MSLYSWMGTPIQFDIPDETAMAYNRVVDAIESVPAHRRGGTISINATHRDLDAWNRVMHILDDIIELNGGDLNYTKEDITSRYLERVRYPQLRG